MKPQSVFRTMQHFLPAYPDTHIWVFSRYKCPVSSHSLWELAEHSGTIFPGVSKAKSTGLCRPTHRYPAGHPLLHPSHPCVTVGKSRQGRCYQNICGNRWCLTEKDLCHSSFTPWHELSGTLDKGKSLKLRYFSSDKLEKKMYISIKLSGKLKRRQHHNKEY